MCGIVGLFLKEDSLHPRLGDMLADMLITMTDRGPDSAGVAIYGDSTEQLKVSVQSDTPELSFKNLAQDCGKAIGAPVQVKSIDTHAIVTTPSSLRLEVCEFLKGKGLRIMSVGEVMEIFKEVGLPHDVVSRFGIRAMSGTHGIGHTRMATESAVTTLGAHPFSTAVDQCLVHNGSLSNHHWVARELTRKGFAPETENDTEVAACYIASRIADGASLGEALRGTLSDLDGFFTFVTGTKDGFGVVRDPVACKPAVLAETEGYVAFGSEYRAFASLPGIACAKVWEPEPAKVYIWER